MDWISRIGSVLKQYAAGSDSAQVAPDAQLHFDQIAQTAPAGAVAEGLAAAFRSDQTPALGQMVSSLFSRSNGEQKAGVLNELMSSVNPATLTEILSGAGLTSLTGALSGGKTMLTPEQAQQIPAEVVQQIATHAEKSSPSVVDSLSNFYAQHSTLAKTLGGTALTIALAKMAERQRQG